MRLRSILGGIELGGMFLIRLIAAMTRRWAYGRAGWAMAGMLLLLIPCLSAESDTDPMQAVVAQVMNAADGRDVTLGNWVLSIENGYDALLLRVHLIRQAKRSIDIQTFIWTNDECGRLMIYELVEAARRGVRVRIIADHMVSDKNPEVGAFLATVNSNFEVRHYRPIMERLNPPLWQKLAAMAWGFHGINQRMHNKLMVVDGQVMLTGGRNIENTYFNHSTGMNFRDRDVLAVGPVAAESEDSFNEYWDFKHTVSSMDLKDVVAAIKQGEFPRYATREDYDFGGFFTELDLEERDPGLMRERFWHRLKAVDRVEFIHDSPGKGRGFRSSDSRTTVELRKRLERARREVVVQSPYLILSPKARSLAKELKGNFPDLQIKISTNSYASTDNIMAYSANYRLRSDYVGKLGLQVYEFKPHPESLRGIFPEFDDMAAKAKIENLRKPPFLCLHAKSLVIDGRVAFVGSYNLDPRSVSLNTEVGLLIEDEAFADELRSEIERDMSPGNSWVIAEREFPLGLQAVNSLIDDALSLSPIDVWPIQNSSSFELRPGAESVPPGHPEFHNRYREVGDFPGADATLSSKGILTRFYKAVGAVFTPIM
jgi:putative cardiolipin synthase